MALASGGEAVNDDERQARLAAIRERLGAATPGPWKIEHDGDVVDIDHGPERTWPWRVITEDETSVIVDFTGGDIPPDEDADLIANAPADLAWLLAENARLGAERDAATARAERAEAALRKILGDVRPDSQEDREEWRAAPWAWWARNIARAALAGQGEW